VREAAQAAACAIGGFIGLHGQTRILKNSDLAWGQIQRLSAVKLEYDFESRVLEKKMAYGLIKDIQGCHIHFGLSSSTSIEKSCDGYTVTP
jgi:hypothetical protein